MFNAYTRASSKNLSNKTCSCGTTVILVAVHEVVFVNSHDINFNVPLPHSLDEE